MVDGNSEFGGWEEEEGEQHFYLIGHVWMICENTLRKKSELHCQFANLQWKFRCFHNFGYFERFFFCCNSTFRQVSQNFRFL